MSVGEFGGCLLVFIGLVLAIGGGLCATLLPMVIPGNFGLLVGGVPIVIGVLIFAAGMSLASGPDENPYDRMKKIDEKVLGEIEQEQMAERENEIERAIKDKKANPSEESGKE